MAGVNSLAISKALPVAGTLTLVEGVPQSLPALDTPHAITQIEVQADINNTDDVLMGNQGAQGWRLHPDDEHVIALSQPGEWWFVAASGTQLLHYIGRD